MASSPDPRLRRSFLSEGFTLFLDAHGIELRVDDHHPLPLRLSWELLGQLRREAERGSGPAAAGGGA